MGLKNRFGNNTPHTSLGQVGRPGDCAQNNLGADSPFSFKRVLRQTRSQVFEDGALLGFGTLVKQSLNLAGNFAHLVGLPGLSGL